MSAGPGVSPVKGPVDLSRCERAEVWVAGFGVKVWRWAEVVGWAALLGSGARGE